MSGRRLPLFPAAGRATPEVSAPRQVLPGRAVSVADTGRDVAALSWAARFVEALGQNGKQVAVVLSSFAAAGDAAARFERLAGARSVRVLAADSGSGLLAAAGSAEHDLWVVVGQPALIAAHAWLSVLVAADAPLLRWPAALRALRGSISLELSGTGLEVASALAQTLAD